jgi:DNA-binding transcriptional regulator YdaS (Cro superfamily)
MYTAALAAIILLVAGLSPTSLSQTSPQVTTTGARNAALIAATKDVLRETSELRQLAILRPVQSSTQSRSEIERMLVKNLDEETTPAQLHAAEVTLKRLGLAPADFQYRALMLRVLTEQVAGYYEPKTGEFHLADWIDLDGQRPVMAHELTHALQDQHFNLRRFEHWPRGDSDSELAAHALIEGDATLAMALYVTSNPLRALAFLNSMKAMGATSVEIEKAPRALRETLLFPYQQGTDWTKSLYKQGGWERVSKAFTELPQSTEQVLHPDKYFVHEAPVKVTQPDITNLLNSSERAALKSVPPASAGGPNTQANKHRDSFAGSADFPSAPSTQREPGFQSNHAQDARATWKRLDYDVQGEWGFYLILDEFLKAPNESRRAAAGWGGDRYAIYEGPKGEVLFASLSTWDTENDAREFFDAYVKRTALRYPGATPIDPTLNPGDRTLSTALRTSDGTVIIELRGNQVVILEGLPQRISPRSALNALWVEIFFKR